MNAPAPIVLIVDDDTDLLDAMAMILVARDYRVLTATSGEQALEVLRERPLPSLILLDLMMPGMNGWMLRERLLENPDYAGIPVIVLSGDHGMLRNTPPLRCARTVTKPLDLKTLLEVVEQGCHPG